MISLLDYAKDFLRSCVPPDGIVADFTMGNGYDTEFLCRLVPEGTVYAFDVQPAALESTRSRLEAFGLTNAQLLLVSHADAARYIKGPLNGGMFNLGWLPGSDRTVFTRRESTIKAVKAASDMLCPGGVLTVSVYPGHDEGRAEGEALLETVSGFDRFEYCVSCLRLVNSPQAPFVLVIERNINKKLKDTDRGK